MDRFSLAESLKPILFAMGMLAALCSAAEAQSGPSARDIVIEQQLIRLTLRREELLETNRAYLAPGIGAGLGVASLVVGGVVFSQAWRGTTTTTCSNGNCSTTDSYNVVMDRTGLVMMPVGAALILLNTPMFAIRLSRARRLERAVRRLELLGRSLALGPSSTGKGVYARLQF